MRDIIRQRGSAQLVHNLGAETARLGLRFRPGRNQHQVVQIINQTIMSRKVNYVLEADIKGFFDNVSHDWLMKFLENDKQGNKEWQKKRLTEPVSETMKKIASIVCGHSNYYGVSGNVLCIQKYWKYLKYSTYRMLNRRDQKGKLSYPKFLRIWNFYVPKPKLNNDVWQWQPKTV